MSKKWISESEILKLFPKANAVLLKYVWRGGVSKSLQELLGRNINFRQREDGEFEYWGRDVFKIQNTLVPWAEFSRGESIWVPKHLVEAQYPDQGRNLDSWRRYGCPFFPSVDNKRPRRQRFLVWEDDNIGLSYRWFYLKSDLVTIDLCLHPSTPSIGETGDAITVDEAANDPDLGVSRSRVYRLLEDGKRVGQDKEVRLTDRERNGKSHKFPFKKRVVSKSKMQEHMDSRKPDTDNRLIVPSEAVKLMEKLAKKWAGDGPPMNPFTVATMARWEEKSEEAKVNGEKEYPCPHLGEPFKVVYQDRLVTFKRNDETVESLQKGAKHYLREQVENAFRVYCKGRAGVRVHRGAEWYSTVAAYRDHGVNQQALQHWGEKGWVDNEDFERIGYGKGAKVKLYRAEGPRGFLRIKNLQDPVRCGRIPPDAAARLDAEAAEKKATELETQGSHSFQLLPEVLPATLPASSQEPGGPSNASPRPKKRRGRPKGSIDPEVADRIKKMLEAWDRREFGDNKAATGRAFNFHKGDAIKIINEHMNRKR